MIKTNEDKGLPVETFKQGMGQTKTQMAKQFVIEPLTAGN